MGVCRLCLINIPERAVDLPTWVRLDDLTIAHPATAFRYHFYLSLISPDVEQRSSSNCTCFEFDGTLVHAFHLSPLYFLSLISVLSKKLFTVFVWKRILWPSTKRIQSMNADTSFRTCLRHRL